MSDTNLTAAIPRWLRVWAGLTTLATLPLVTLGAEVTTKKVGMVDPVGVRSPLYLFKTISTPQGDQLLIAHLFRTGDWANLTEHGHRLVGWFVGLCCIVLALGLTIQGRGWYRALGWLALVAVGLQGILGALRVNWNALAGPELACLHGCLAQLVFGVLVSVTVMCSRAWSLLDAGNLRPLRGVLLGLCALIYLQVVLGAVLRHLLDPLAQRLHVLLAFAIVVKVFWLLRRVHQLDAPLLVRRLTTLLTMLIVLQPLLGVEAWIRRFGAATVPDAVPWTLSASLARSGHHVVGTLIFSTAIALTVCVWRRALVVEDKPMVPKMHLEGVA